MIHFFWFTLYFSDYQDDIYMREASQTILSIGAKSHIRVNFYQGVGTVSHIIRVTFYILREPPFSWSHWNLFKLIRPCRGRAGTRKDSFSGVCFATKRVFLDSTILSLTVLPREKPSFGANHFVQTFFALLYFRGAIPHQIRSFLTLFKKPLTPPQWSNRPKWARHSA